MAEFTKIFDDILIHFAFVDLELWVGAEEVLKILRLPQHALRWLPDSEKRPLRCIDGCAPTTESSNRLYVTALGVGLLVSRLVTRGCVIDNIASNEMFVPHRIDAFANVFLSEVVSELRRTRYLVTMSQQEDEILASLANTDASVGSVVA